MFRKWVNWWRDFGQAVAREREIQMQLAREAFSIPGYCPCREDDDWLCAEPIEGEDLFSSIIRSLEEARDGDISRFTVFLDGAIIGHDAFETPGSRSQHVTFALSPEQFVTEGGHLYGGDRYQLKRVTIPFPTDIVGTAAQMLGGDLTRPMRMRITFEPAPKERNENGQEEGSLCGCDTGGSECCGCGDGCGDSGDGVSCNDCRPAAR